MKLFHRGTHESMPRNQITRRAHHRGLFRPRLSETNGLDGLVEACFAVEKDGRLQFGAYVTDGMHLYEVRGISCGAGRIGFAAVRLILEDCHSLSTVEFLLDKIRRQFTLVRPAAATT
jgi:hypothetical protein